LGNGRNTFVVFIHEFEFVLAKMEALKYLHVQTIGTTLKVPLKVGLGKVLARNDKGLLISPIARNLRFPSEITRSDPIAMFERSA
jgi:hypothetical protein